MVFTSPLPKHLIRFLPLITSLFILACIPMGSKTYDEVEPDDLPNRPTYESHVRDIILEKCALCHSYKYGKVYEDISYDTYEDVIPFTGSLTVPNNNGEDEEDEEDEEKKGWQGIKNDAIDEMTMPPGGKERFTPREFAILLRWESQGFAKN